MDILKSLHIIFMVSWFAGLFYMVRLFIYHKEAQDKEEVERSILSDQFVTMEKKLWWIITTPSMAFTVIFGNWMLLLNWEYYKVSTWMHLKLGFVVLLLIYHFICQKILFDFSKDNFKWTSTQLRIWNEVATLFLVSIVFLVVLKNSLNWINGVIGFFAVGITLMIAIKWYKRLRNS
ncbi:MAG: CopD family protein [Bacteroidota bacterium]